MAGSIDVTVNLRGGLFGKNIPSTVRDALNQEALGKINERMRRKGDRGSGGRGKGVQRNVVSQRFNPSDMELRIYTTSVYPRRRKAGSFKRKNIAIIRSMAPRVMRKAAERIAAEMGR